MALWKQSVADGETPDWKVLIKQFTISIDKMSEDNQNDTVYLYRGISYNQLLSFEKAIADLTKAIKINRLSPSPYYHRAIAYYCLDSLERSLKDCNTVLDEFDNAGFNTAASLLKDKAIALMD